MTRENDKLLLSLLVRYELYIFVKLKEQSVNRRAQQYNVKWKENKQIKIKIKRDEKTQGFL